MMDSRDPPAARLRGKTGEDRRPWVRWTGHHLPLLVISSITLALFVSPYLRQADVPTKRSRGSTPVTVSVVRRDSVVRTTTAPGVVVAAAEARVAAQTTAIVQAVFVDIGSTVRRGQPLATLDDRLLQSDLVQAEAALARSADETARVALLSTKRLTDARREQAAIAQERIDRAVVARTRTLLAISRFPSPTSGVVTARHVDPGASVEAGAPLFTVADVSRLRLDVKVPEGVAATLQLGAPVEVRVPALGGAVLHARLARIYPMADPVSHQTTLELDLGRAYPRIKPGYLATATIRSDARSSALVVDRAAFADDPASGTAEVFVARNGRAEIRRVRLGLVAEDRVEILDGLAVGDSVIVRHDGSLAAGAAVAVDGAERTARRTGAGSRP